MRISDWSSDVCSSDLEELVGAQVERLDVDDALDLGAVLDRGEDAGVVGFGRALAHEETLGLDAEDDRADDEERADEEGADRVEDRVVGDGGEPDAQQREDEAGQRGDGFREGHGPPGGAEGGGWGKN